MLSNMEEDEFYEDDEPIEQIRALADRLPFDGVTAEPADVRDVAVAVLERLNGPVDALRLQKLCYYAQARHLADHGGPLFTDRIEAWTHGPVVRSLWETHRQHRFVTARMIGGDAERLQDHPSALAVIDDVIRDFGEWSGWQLRELTHREQPWREARAGLPANAWSDQEIPTGQIRDYYRSLADIPGDSQS